MRSPLLAAAISVVVALVTTGCAPTYAYVRADTSARGRVAIIRLNDGFHYLIDPHSESCFFLYGGSTILIPCGKLKKNVPEAAAKIRWLPDAPPGGPDAAVPPPLPPTQPPGAMQPPR